MVPEIWLPTETVMTALIVPVAVIVSTIAPRSSLPVRYLGAPFSPALWRYTPVATAAARTMPIRSFLMGFPSAPRMT